VVARDLEALDAAGLELSLCVRLFAFAGLWKVGHNSDAVFDEGPVGSIDTVLAAFWSGYLVDFNAGLLEAVDDRGVLGTGLFDVNFVLVVVRVDFVIVRKKVCARYEEFLIDHLDRIGSLVSFAGSEAFGS